MKKQLLTIIVLALIGLGAEGQPTLTQTNCAPAASDGFYLYNACDPVPVGASGANVTWDFSGLTNTGNYHNIVSTANNTNYPSANIDYNVTGVDFYYGVTSSSYTFSGIKVFTNSDEVLTDVETILTFPFNFNSTFTDNWSGTITQHPSGATQSWSGSTEVTADAYGTLILPYGTYNNVMRVKTIRTQTTTTTSMDTSYYWYLPGVHNFILKLNSNFGSAGSMYRDQSNLFAGINEYTTTNTISLFPNPTTGKFILNNTSSKIESITIYNLVGEKVYQSIINNTQAEIDLSGERAGVYFVRILDERKNIINKKIVLQ